MLRHFLFFGNRWVVFDAGIDIRIHGRAGVPRAFVRAAATSTRTIVLIAGWGIHIHSQDRAIDGLLETSSKSGKETLRGLGMHRGRIPILFVVSQRSLIGPDPDGRRLPIGLKPGPLSDGKLFIGVLTDLLGDGEFFRVGWFGNGINRTNRSITPTGGYIIQGKSFLRNISSSRRRRPVT